MKKEYLFLGLVIAALAAYLAFRNSDRTHYRLPVLSKVSADAITKIEIDGPDGSIVLNRRDDRWTVAAENYPADAGRVRQMLAVIEQPVLTALVSESKSYDRYDLTKEKKISVKAWAGDALKRELDIGKAASSFKHTFVKLSGDPRVYHARNSFRFTFEGSVDNLRDKTVLDFEIKDITEIDIEEKDRQLRFLLSRETAGKDDGVEDGEHEAVTPEAAPVWKRAGGEPLDSGAVNRFLANLDELACDRYLHDDRKVALRDPLYTVTLKGTRTHRLTLYAPDASEKAAYPATSSDNDYPFELTQFRGEEIIEAFAETSPESPEP